MVAAGVVGECVRLVLLYGVFSIWVYHPTISLLYRNTAPKHEIPPQNNMETDNMDIYIHHSSCCDTIRGNAQTGDP